MNKVDTTEWWHIEHLIELRKQGVELLPIEGGVHVKTLPNGQCVDVLRLLYNHRVVRSDPGHTTTDRGWCYAGRGPETYLHAVGEALAWDGADHTEPAGWIKRIHPIAVRPETGV